VSAATGGVTAAGDVLEAGGVVSATTAVGCCESSAALVCEGVIDVLASGTVSVGSGVLSPVQLILDELCGGGGNSGATS